MLGIVSTSAGDAFLVGLAQVGYAPLIRSDACALPIHRAPGQQRRLRDSKLLKHT